MADKKSLSDLAELTKEPAAEAPAAEATEAEAPEAAERRAAPPPAEPTPLREQQLDKFGRAYATGRRKDAVARVWLKPGSGKIDGQRPRSAVYFARPTLRLVINQPFDVADRTASMTSSRPSSVAGFRVRPVRSSTASPRR
jgi:small subunit ribosomal protein S9